MVSYDAWFSFMNNFVCYLDKNGSIMLSSKCNFCDYEGYHGSNIKLNKAMINLKYESQRDTPDNPKRKNIPTGNFRFFLLIKLVIFPRYICLPGP